MRFWSITNIACSYHIGLLKLRHENDVDNCNDESDSNDENILINNVLFLPITDYDKPIDVKKTCTDSTCVLRLKKC